jgi:hypothetical protein
MPRANAVIYSLPDVVQLDGGELVLPIPIPADGAYTLVLDFLTNTLSCVANFSAGDNATFPQDGLVPGFIYVGQLLDPSGQPVPFQVNGRTFDGVEFVTR